jgi:hypothetical protein
LGNEANPMRSLASVCRILAALVPAIFVSEAVAQKTDSAESGH